MAVHFLEGFMKNVEILRIEWKRKLDEKEEMLIEKDRQIEEYLNKQNT